MKFVMERRLWPRLEALGLRTSAPTTATCATTRSAARSWRPPWRRSPRTRRTSSASRCQLKRLLRGGAPGAAAAQRPRAGACASGRAGCSTGEEAYTLAMLLHEQRPVRGLGRAGVHGTDISRRVLATARAGGVWRRPRCGPTSPELMSRYFERSWRPRASGCGSTEIRALVSFGQLNLLDPERAVAGAADGRHLLPQRDDLLRPAARAGGCCRCSTRGWSRAAT